MKSSILLLLGFVLFAVGCTRGEEIVMTPVPPETPQPVTVEIPEIPQPVTVQTATFALG